MVLFTIAEYSYLAFEDGPPLFMQIFFHTNLFNNFILHTGLSPSLDYLFQDILLYILLIG
jgi:hypothetical protein